MKTQDNYRYFHGDGVTLKEYGCEFWAYDTWEKASIPGVYNKAYIYRVPERDNKLEEIARLTREPSQLRDEIDTEKFPEGYDWHNPTNLSPDCVGVNKGWRLLLKSEIISERNCTYEIQGWSGGKWDSTSWCGADDFITYRTKWPLPSAVKTPNSNSGQSLDDGFPTPDKERNQIIKAWLLEQAGKIE